MSILSGGACAYGAIVLGELPAPLPGVLGTGRKHQITAPPKNVDVLSQNLQIVPCPLGQNRHVLRAHISYQDYVAVPERSGKGAEVNARNTQFLLPWGEERIHYWRVLVDPWWKTYDGETGTLIAQIHEVGTNSPPGQPPNLYFEIQNGVLSVNRAHDDLPAGANVFSMPVSPGQELDFSVRCRWVDGIHAVNPAWGGMGLIEIYINGKQAYYETLAHNCWADVGDNTQPFPVFGVYNPNNGAGWWVNRNRTMYHVGFASGDSAETHASLAAFVASRLVR